MSYRYRCTNRASGPKDGKKPPPRKVCGLRISLTKAEHERAKAGENFECPACRYPLTFTPADYKSDRKRSCSCGGRPLPHKRGQKGCLHCTKPNMGFENEDDWRSFLDGLRQISIGL